MKKILLLTLISLTILSLTACQNRDTSSDTDSSSAISSSEISGSSEALVESQPEESEHEEDAEIAIFQMSDDEATRKAIGVGDKYGEWTLSGLDIDYAEAGRIKMLTAEFSGEVTLKGKITRNVLLEEAYDFTVSDENIGKIPQYIPPEALDDSTYELRDTTMFMLDIPEGLENSPKLDFDEELPCTITISDYRYVFAYMMAPSGAVVTKIDIETK